MAFVVLEDKRVGRWYGVSEGASITMATVVYQNYLLVLIGLLFPRGD
jgi:hypothetical protein